MAAGTGVGQVDEACARVTWLRGDRAAMDRAADVFKLALVPEMETFDGFCGVSLLINRRPGWPSRASPSTVAPRWKETANKPEGFGRAASQKPDWRSPK